MTVTPPKPDESGAQTLDPVRLIWDVMTSPVTFMLSALALGLLLALGTYIGQGMTEGDLLAQRSFASARALLGLGLGDLATSWLVWLFGLLLTLNVVGLLLRHVWLTPLEARDWGGPTLDHATWTTSRSIEAVTASMDGHLGRTSPLPGGVAACTGYWVEGLAILAVAFVAHRLRRGSPSKS